MRQEHIVAVGVSVANNEAISKSWYLGRTLTRDDFDRVGVHVHSCETCYRDFLAELQERFPIEIDLDELAGLEGWHLEGEELAAYVEGRMNELNFECASLHLRGVRLVHG